ncbi:MAG: DNA-3-methyladenine glycosylase 2 family protein [Chitinophaga sp.]|jgi:DNA-3-methyladenine glycosylase II|nr:DNA-3-methyladenine glycosylase 2 family protein [Chitinophaga sp.]
MKHIEHLQKDKKLAKLLHLPIRTIKLHKNIPLRLMASIMSQQLNTKVAAVIYSRFINLFNGKEPKPQQVLAMPFEKLRAVGLSNSKVTYIQNVAAFCIEHKITDKRLMKMSNEEIIALLTQIKGVGQWTVEMLLMFSLGREDIFSVDDLGIQNAMIGIYKLDKTNKKLLKEKMITLSAKWAPYRTYACLYLWHWKDNVPDTKKKPQ